MIHLPPTRPMLMKSGAIIVPPPPPPLTIGTPINIGHAENASAVSLAVTTLADIPAGYSILIHHYSANSSSTVVAASVVDPSGNVYANAYSNSSTTPVAQITAAKNSTLIPAGSIITVPFAVGGFRHGITIWAVQNLAALPTDVNTNIFRNTGIASGTLTFPALAQQSELLITLLTAGAAPGAITFDTGFTGLGGASATAFAMPAYKIVTNGVGGTATTSWVNSISAFCGGIALKGA